MSPATRARLTSGVAHHRRTVVGALAGAIVTLAGTVATQARASDPAAPSVIMQQIAALRDELQQTREDVRELRSVLMGAVHRNERE